MKRILRLLAPPLSLLVLGWAAITIWLRNSTGEVSDPALVASFIGTPLATLAAWYGVRALLARRKPMSEAVADRAASPTEEAPTASTSGPPLAILASEVITFSGDDTDRLLADLTTGEIQPRLSECKVGGRSLPVMLANAGHLDDASPGKFVEEWAGRTEPTHPAHSDPERGNRLLALLAGPVRHAKLLLTSLHLMKGEAESEGPDTRRPLLIKLYAPAEWEDMLEAWILEQLAALPGVKPDFAREQPTHSIRQTDALRVAETFRANPAHASSSALLMIVASDSLCNEARISTLDATGTLFAGTFQNGVVPGEAAALVLASCGELPPLEPMARLYSANSGERDGPVDADARSDFAVIQRLADELLGRHGIDASSIACVVSDCDQRKAWNGEMSAFISARLDRLDSFTDHIALGRSFGDTGAAASTLALALGIARSLQASAPCLVACVAGARSRSCAVVGPWVNTTT